MYCDDCLKLEQLKQAVVDEWCELSQKFIDHIINELPLHLKCVVHQNGRHIEHLFKQRFSCRLYTTFLLLFMHVFHKLLLMSSYMCQKLLDSVKAFERYRQTCELA